MLILQDLFIYKKKFKQIWLKQFWNTDIMIA